jgi:hypothetical protein
MRAWNRNRKLEFCSKSKDTSAETNMKWVIKGEKNLVKASALLTYEVRRISAAIWWTPFAVMFAGECSSVIRYFLVCKWHLRAMKCLRHTHLYCNGSNDLFHQLANLNLHKSPRSPPASITGNTACNTSLTDVWSLTFTATRQTVRFRALIRGRIEDHVFEVEKWSTGQVRAQSTYRSRRITYTAAAKQVRDAEKTEG